MGGRGDICACVEPICGPGWLVQAGIRRPRLSPPYYRLNEPSSQVTEYPFGFTARQHACEEGLRLVHLQRPAVACLRLKELQHAIRIIILIKQETPRQRHSCTGPSMAGRRPAPACTAPLLLFALTHNAFRYKREMGAAKRHPTKCKVWQWQRHRN